MALCRPFFALTIKPPISDVREINLRAKNHANYRVHRNKAPLNIFMKQNIHLLDSKKFLEDDIHIKHAKALREVNQILINKVRENAIEGLFMIDNIQRLAMEYYFEEGIEAAIKKQYLIFGTQMYHGNDDLELVALQFRLLRQEGCYVPEDVFDNFKDNKGSLRHEFSRNIEGLVGLFEASQLSIEGEDDLDKAGDFSRQLLNAWLLRFKDHRNGKIVANRLQYPIQTNLSRFTPRCFQSRSSLATRGWTVALEELSELDTDLLVNSIHLKEIFAVSKWWKDLGLSKDLKFARDEPIKWYMWSMACITNPCFSEERIEITKPVSLVYIIDDIFDACGSMDELVLFNDAVERWDLAALEQLPDYMKACFKALYDITNEFAYKVQKRHGWNPINSLIKSWVRLCNAFMEEAKWFSTGQLPAAEEYLKNGLVSTGVHMTLVHTFFLLGEGITKEAVALLDDFPNLIASTCTILPLYDDLEGDKDGSDDDKDGSYMKYYMKDNPRVSSVVARQHVTQMISSAWKCLNQEIMNPSTPFPLSFSKICLNAARMIPLMYGDDDSKHSRSRLEDHIRSLLYGSGGISIPQDQT